MGNKCITRIIYRNCYIASAVRKRKETEVQRVEKKQEDILNVPNSSHLQEIEKSVQKWRQRPSMEKSCVGTKKKCLQNTML